MAAYNTQPQYFTTPTRRRESTISSAASSPTSSDAGNAMSAMSHPAEAWSMSSCLIIEIEDEDLMFDGKPLRLLHEESAGSFSWEGGCWMVRERERRCVVVESESQRSQQMDVVEERGRSRSRGK